jgi:hypothetical protein
MYWYCAHNIVWWLLLRVVVVVVVAMPLVRGDVGVRSVFLFVVCGFVVVGVRCAVRVPSII